MTTKTYLITGATGDTGRHTAFSLLDRGLGVRAFVHTLDERSDALRKAGADIVQGDLIDIDSVRAALDGAAGAYFVYPLRPGLLDATAYFAQAAKEAGTPVVVNMSQISARRDAASNAARNHWIGERILDWSGVPTVHVRPTYFAQWLLYPHVRAGIREEGAIKLPFGDGRHAPIAAEDQGRTIAAILADPAHHIGKTHVLNGPVEMDEYGIAAAVSEALGKTVRYQPISIDDYRERLAASGLWPYLIQHLVEVGIDCSNGVFEGTDQVIERITGTPPMTVQAFVDKHRAAFG
jgi:NAD(P)H dehydrogenase (quinone)